LVLDWFLNQLWTGWLIDLKVVKNRRNTNWYNNICDKKLPFYNNHAWGKNPNAATGPLKITILEGERLCLYPIEQIDMVTE
jgi:hypothetical protein